MASKYKMREVKSIVGFYNKLLKKKRLPYSSMPKSPLFRKQIGPDLFAREAIEVVCIGGLRLARFSEIGRNVELLNAKQVLSSLECFKKHLDELLEERKAKEVKTDK